MIVSTHTSISPIMLLIFLFHLLMIQQIVSASFYLNLENVNIEKSSQFGAVIDVNKISVVRSVCLRVLVTQTKKPQTIFYTPDKDDLVLQWNFESKLGFLRINRKWIIFKIPVPIVPFVYNSFCFSLNETNYSVMCNGVLWYTYQLLPSDIPTILQPVNITKLIFGPAGYSLTNGGYFLGRLSELYIFSTSFNDEELISMTESCKTIGNEGSRVLDWSKLSPFKDILIPQDNTNIKIVEGNVEDFCSKVKSKQIDLLPFGMDIQTAMLACPSLGGQMFNPDYEDENILRQDFERESSVLQKLIMKSCRGTSKLIWLPIYKIGLSTWVDYNNKSKEIGQMSEMIVANGNELQRCGYLKFSTYYYGDTTCTIKSCTFCEWNQKKQFSFRGFCEDNTLEDQYLLTNQLFFNGIFGKHQTLIQILSYNINT